jgi:hypothetical protein
MSEEEYGSRPKAPVVSPNELGQCAATAPGPSIDWLVRSSSSSSWSSSIRNQCFLPTVDRAGLRRLCAAPPSPPYPDELGHEDDTPELDTSTDSSLDLDTSLCHGYEMDDDSPLQYSLETTGKSAWDGRLNLHLARTETLQALAALGRKYSNPSQRPVSTDRVALGHDFGRCSALACGTKVQASTEYYPAPVIHLGCLLQTIHAKETENPSHLSTTRPLLQNAARLADEKALSCQSHTDSDSTGPIVAPPRSFWPETAWRWTCAVVVMVLFMAASVRRIARPYRIDLLPLRRLLVTNWTGWEIPQIGVYPFAKDLSYTMTRTDSMDVEHGANVTLRLPVRFTAHPARERDKSWEQPEAQIHRAAASNRFDCLPFPHPTVDCSWLTTKTNVCERQSFAEHDETLLKSTWKEQNEATSASPLSSTKYPSFLCENPANRKVFNPSPEPIADIAGHIDPTLNASDTSSRRHQRKPIHVQWSALGRLCQTLSRRAHGWIQRHWRRAKKGGTNKRHGQPNQRPLAASFPSFRNDDAAAQMDFLGVPLVEIVGKYLRDRARVPQTK